VGRRVKWLEAVISAARVRLATASANSDEAARALQKVERQRVTALTMGADGRCETCGGTFGNRLEDALGHFARDESSCTLAGESAQRRMAKVEAQLARFERALEAAQIELDRCSEEIRAQEATPGELHAVQKQRDDLREAIAQARRALPAAFQHATYDARRHEELKVEARKRQAAEQTLQLVGDIANRRRSIAEQLNDARTRSREIEGKLAQATTRLDKLRVSDEQLDAAQREEQEAKDKQDEIAHRIGEAKMAVALSDERIRRAEQDVETARVARAREDAARRDLSVAQQAGQILRTVLTTLGDEARPRMEELMMESLPALYGRRFRAVQLSNDFRLQADNGTGLHELEHFSGGEQTILSILLRVAIAQFCRERAGFDTGFLIFDEVFGNQDPEHRQALLAFLEDLRVRYDQIILVNHIDEVTDQLDSVLRVVPTSENVSTVVPG
jgi:exonuclease SbcC